MKKFLPKFKNSCNRFVWAYGIYIGILGMILFSPKLDESAWNNVGNIISCSLTLGLLMWTGAVLANSTSSTANKKEEDHRTTAADRDLSSKADHCFDDKCCETCEGGHLLCQHRAAYSDKKCERTKKYHQDN